MNGGEGLLCPEGGPRGLAADEPLPERWYDDYLSLEGEFARVADGPVYPPVAEDSIQVDGGEGLQFPEDEQYAVAEDEPLP